jgi:hypothetical protein
MNKTLNVQHSYLPDVHNTIEIHEINSSVYYFNLPARQTHIPKILGYPYTGKRWTTSWMIEGSSTGKGSELLSSPPRPDRFWGHPASYPMDTRGSFAGGKAPGAWSWPLTPI